MKERLADDWLSRINERGYDVAFCQVLLSGGKRVLRAGHSPVEHGKDVIATSADQSSVWAYQLKTGDITLKDVQKLQGQLSMLVETRPMFPGLAPNFNYHPVLVTTGEFNEPAMSLIKELNESWRARNLSALEVINGRSLLADFLELSHDFWPIAAPDVRTLRSLYLVDGNGDFDPKGFGELMMRLMQDPIATKNVGRQAAAANLFASYLLGPFYENADHWSIFSGWTITAAAIAWAGESGKSDRSDWHKPFLLAREAAENALSALAKEAADENSFRAGAMEFDDYTRVRNTTVMAAVAGAELIAGLRDEKHSAPAVVARIKSFSGRGRFLYWGEGAMSQHLVLFWLLKREGEGAAALSFLLEIIRLVVNRQQRNSTDPLPNPYLSPDECLTEMFSEIHERLMKDAVESGNLYPLIMLCARHNLRDELEALWPKITNVSMSWLFVENPVDVLQWNSDGGTEHTQQFGEQSWVDLLAAANSENPDRLPHILWTDYSFAVMFILVFRHRMLASLIKRLDDVLVVSAK